MAQPVQNSLLSSLSGATRARLLTRLEPVALPLRTVLFEPGVQPRYVHFITSGVASVVAEISVGEGVEVGLVAHEGVAEYLHLLGPEAGTSRCFMQMEGTALRGSFRSVKDEFEQDAEFRGRMLRYVQYQSLIVAQLAACNRLHEVEERLSRWLAMVADRIDAVDLDLTQEFLAQMLGARRSTVTLTAGALQRSGLIRYQRGRLEILDRDGLESAACECLDVTKRLLRQLYK